MNILPPTDSASRKKKLLIIGAAVLVVGLAVAGFFIWRHFSDPTRENRETATRIQDQVAKIYELPTEEEPNIARLEDPEKLPKDDFYKKAQKGDYILVYANEKLALIYRESAKKLINVDYVEIGKKQ